MHTVNELVQAAEQRLRESHIRPMATYPKPVIVVSTEYPGVWLEHCYDAVMWARLFPDGIDIMKNTLEMFLSYQREDGQLPCYVRDEVVGYTQVQECVSFARLALEAYRICGDRELLYRCYKASERWARWIECNRMTTGQGLVEMFVGFDTGHDNSGRLEGLTCPGKYIGHDACDLPPDDKIAPVIAVDMSCNYYGTLASLAKMGEILGIENEYAIRAAEVKRRLIEVCYDETDAFFYDVDKNGEKRKYLSSTVFHLFLEGVLNPSDDREMIDTLLRRHILNPEEFMTRVPFPSMAVRDPSRDRHKRPNSWGYYSEALIALRCTLWMDEYGLDTTFDRLCRAWIDGLTESYDEVKFGQELDPITGEPSGCSEWYSSAMLFYIYAARRLGLA